MEKSGLVPGLISVIMTNYNTDEEYLREAIESILKQTYNNIEFIIVDDCSTDGSPDVIASYRDPRIVLIRNEKNLGLTKSLNIGIARARGEYIARMDSDDVSYPHRFEKQVKLLEENPSAIVCGTWTDYIGPGAKKLRNKVKTIVIPDNETFRIWLLFGNHCGYIHSNVIFRHRMLTDNGITYNEAYPCGQDFRMWVECSKYGDCLMLEEIQFSYRLHDKSVSVTRRQLQDECGRRIIEEQLALLNIHINDEEYLIHLGLLSGRKDYSTEYLKWIKKLIAANREYKVYDRRLFEDMLWRKWTEIVYFGLRGRSVAEKIEILSTLPIGCYPELIRIYSKRRKL